MSGELEVTLSALACYRHFETFRFIVAPNIMHHYFLKGYKDQYPNAKVIGPKDLNKKKEGEGWQLDGGSFNVSCGSLMSSPSQLVFDAEHPDTKHGFEDEVSPSH